MAGLMQGLGKHPTEHARGQLRERVTPMGESPVTFATLNCPVTGCLHALY